VVYWWYSALYSNINLMEVCNGWREGAHIQLIASDGTDVELYAHRGKRGGLFMLSGGCECVYIYIYIYTLAAYTAGLSHDQKRRVQPKSRSMLGCCFTIPC
jgi:hypothetical protein